MRIFFVAQSTPNELQLPHSALWDANLYHPLLALGHDVCRFSDQWISRAYDLDPSKDVDRNLIDAARPEFSQRLLDAVCAAHKQRPLDLFFSYFSTAHAEPGVIREISRLGIPTVNWYCNASYQFHLVAEIAAAFDYCLVPERFRLNDYRAAGATPIYCQEAANPDVYKPYDLPLDYDTTFVGQKYGTRPAYLGKLYQGGVDVRAWGPGWVEDMPWQKRFSHAVRDRLRMIRGRALRDLPRSRCGAPLSDDELVKMYSRSRISLGFSTVAESLDNKEIPVKQVRLRDFEATMSGAFYMVEAFDELAEFFEPDREIVFFETPEELVSKAKYYLCHDRERQDIRDAGMRRARSEHTWQQRFKMVFDKIGLKGE